MLYRPYSKKERRSVKSNLSITPDLNDALKERAGELGISFNELCNKYLARGIMSDKRQAQRKRHKEEQEQATSDEWQEELNNTMTDDTNEQQELPEDLPF